ncbi:solute carrier family 22 member 15-like [Limulus polyphemus]|uniref:Solute carrier family 22 member 15-like n=1 Tax=Limulus polyphemus TaxID=6850 RepID=A0ABM1SXC7_LIMPO|nr:solute carrier family 22 member 15-like [Limulus polyphemus]
MNQTVFMLGMLIGVFISGHLSDRFGRRPVLLGSLCLSIVSSYAGAAVPNLSFFYVTRFCSAMGVAGIQNAGVCLCMLFHYLRKCKVFLQLSSLRKADPSVGNSRILSFATSFLYYALTFGSARLGGNMYINLLISAAVELPVCVVLPLVVKFVKRKPPIIVSFVVTCVACVLVIVVPEDMVVTKISLTMIGKMFIATVGNINFVYGGEVFPTVIRTVGVGTAILCSRIGAAIAPFVRELSKSTHVAVPSVIYGVLSIVAAIMVFLLPETFNRQLSDTILEIENPEKLAKYQTEGPIEETELEQPVTA